MNELQKIAVVIDADNTQLSKIGAVLREISTHGRIVVKRAYGNWRKEGLKNWEPEIKRLAIKAEQQFDYVSGKRKIIASELASVTSKIAALEKEKDSEEQQMAFFQSENMVEIFDKKIAAVPINAVAIEKEIKRLEKALQSIRKEITDKTKANNSVVSSLYRNIVKYATELGVGNSETIAASYIFTSNLKELSGAVLHKTVFAFRLAYIIEIEKALGIKLPIILDSPSGKEVDQTNIQLMVDILKRDFADNQIIIASIFRYDFDEVKTIEIVNRLIE